MGEKGAESFAPAIDVNDITISYEVHEVHDASEPPVLIPGLAADLSEY